LYTYRAGGANVENILRRPTDRAHLHRDKNNEEAGQMTRARLFIIGAAACVFLQRVNGQASERDIREVTAYTGGVTGLGSHSFVGASDGIAFAKYGVAMIEFSYSPLGNQTLRSLSGLIVRQSHLYDINATGHIRFPIGKRWAPYALLGPSVLWNSYQFTHSNEAGSVWNSRTDANFGFHAGGGFRFHINEHWGLRPEMRVIISNQTYVAFSIGVFFNVPIAQ
jgi:opacity protein-like surface antigen